MIVDEQLDQLEREVVQTAITAHCKSDDKDAQERFHEAVSLLIEARYQSVKKAS